MLPSLRHRVVIVLGIVAIGLLYLLAAPAAKPADGAAGVVLVHAAHPATAIGMFAAVSLAAALIGCLVGGLGNPLSAGFCVAIGLTFAAVRGGSIDSWIRGIASAANFWGLAAESLIWLVMLLLATMLSIALARRLRPRLPAAFFGARPLTSDAAAITGPLGDTVPAPLVAPLGTLFSVVTGGLAAALLLRSPDTYQVLWALFLSFTLSSLAAQTLLPARSPIGLIISPLLAAAAAHAYIALSGDSSQRVLAAYFNRTLFNPAMALPIFYASAGVAGAITGYAWARLFEETGEEPVTTPVPTASV
jgi:hypothetical protein